jgi:succinate dehydrogenase / fumarate reductase cytochrome b subunit
MWQKRQQIENAEVCMSATIQDPAKARPPKAVVPELPPAMPVSKIESKPLPSWGLKFTMAVTGTVGVLFLCAHLFGNLKVFTGPEHFNAYAEGLRTFGSPILPDNFLLWILRIVLAVALVCHVCCAAILWYRSRKARGPFKAKRHNGFTAFSATLMPITGIFILLFVVFHIMDLTLLTKPVASPDASHGAVAGDHAYQNLIASFDRPWTAIVYIVMMLLICIHISHGLWTVATDFGAVGRRWRTVFVILAGLVALVVLLGNAAIPVAVQIGLVS